MASYIRLEEAVRLVESMSLLDLKEILSAEGYWSPVDRMPTAAGMAVSTKRGFHYLWDADFLHQIKKKYSMAGLIAPLEDFLAVQVRCHQIRLYPSMFPVDEQDCWQDMVPIAMADLVNEIWVWGVSRRTPFEVNVSRFNRWLKKKAVDYGFQKHVILVQRRVDHRKNIKKINQLI
jgi:hypothetical protein